MILECIYIPKKVRLFRRDHILIRDIHLLEIIRMSGGPPLGGFSYSPCTLLTLAASVAAVVQCVSKLTRCTTLRAFVIWHSYGVHIMRFGHANKQACCRDTHLLLY